MLVLGESGFPSYELWTALTGRGAATLFRISSKWVLPVLTPLCDGSYLSVILDPARQSPIRKSSRRQARGNVAAEHDYLRKHGTTCRVVEYQLTAGSHTS